VTDLKMNLYTILAIGSALLFVALAVVGVMVEPVKKSAGWYTILVFMGLTIFSTVVFIIIDHRVETKNSINRLKQNLNLNEMNRLQNINSRIDSDLRNVNYNVDSDFRSMINQTRYN
jgi:hypothetical protein